LNLNGDRFKTPEQRFALANRIQEKLAAIPGVQYAAVSSNFPLDEDNLLNGRPARFQVIGSFRNESELPPVTSIRAASPDYFRALGITVLNGRTFELRDQPKGEQVVVLSRALAQRTFGNTDPIGKQMIQVDDQDKTKYTVVGVVGDVKEFGLAAETPYSIYAPISQFTFLGSALVRTTVNPEAMEEQMRRVLNEVEPYMAVIRVQTMEQVKMKSVASPRTLTRLFSLFAALAFIISITGIASMLALWVRERTRETGIRIALCALPWNILSLVIRQGMWVTIAGVFAGLVAAAMVTRVLTILLFQVKPTDPVTYTLISALLLCAALLACYIPARRAAHTDPQLALRCE